jgi:L,D-transpeptidase catalytic domain/Putative peptidoglycan binding domain
LGRKFEIAIVVAVAVMLIAAVAAYAWDESRSDEISEGVRVGSVDVGGLTTGEATDLVRHELVTPLRKPITVTFEDVKYRLSPEKLEVEADVDGMVDRALDVSREGGLPGRLWRYATGGEVTERIEPQVTYSEGALDDFVAKIEAEVNRDPVDATIQPTSTSLGKVEGRNGIALVTDELRSELDALVQRPDDRRIKAPVETVKPEVTVDELAEAYPTYLTVDRSGFQLHHWQNLELTKTYTIAVGAVGFDTPAGVYNIQNKAVDPAWSVPEADWAGDLAGTVVPGGVPENPLKERWMGIFDGAGIHGTDDVGSLGSAASHGCIRMSVPDVIELYDQVDVGTPIYIG